MIACKKKCLGLFFLLLSFWCFSSQEEGKSYRSLGSFSALEKSSNQEIYYTRGRKLGSGAFGDVILFQSEGRPSLALKFPSGKNIYESRELEIEAQEAQALTQLIQEEKESSGFDARRYFVQFLFFYKQGLHKAIVYRCIPGENLNFYKKYGGDFSLSAIRVIAYQVLIALDFLQRHHLVHFDLKPENIMITPSERVVIVDLGSLRHLKREPLHETDYKVTRYYRSPENVFGLSDQANNDIWSLGCILAELYLGVPLFKATVGEYELPSLWIGILGPLPEGFKGRLIVIERRQGIRQNRYRPSLSFIEREVRLSEENYLLENPCGIDPKLRQKIFRQKMKSQKEAPLSHEEVSELEKFQELLWETLQYLPPERKRADKLLQSPWFNGCKRSSEPGEEFDFKLELKKLEKPEPDSGSELNPEETKKSSNCSCLRSLWHKYFSRQPKDKHL